ncbi:MAG: hypothetical protein ACK56F_17150, partial [bacterium]
MIVRLLEGHLILVRLLLGSVLGARTEDVHPGGDRPDPQANGVINSEDHQTNLQNGRNSAPLGPYGSGTPTSNPRYLSHRIAGRFFA